MKITDVRALPLAIPIDRSDYRARGGDHKTVSIVLVEVTTDEGIRGYGEGLARHAPKAHAALIDGLLKRVYLGQDPFDAERLLHAAKKALTGRSGGIQMEAIAALDIALWDIMGKATGLPIHRLLAGMGRSRLPAYASCPPQVDEDATIAYLQAAVARGYRMLKLVFNGEPVEEVLAFARRAREALPPEVRLAADANTSYDLDDAIRIARGLADLNFFWFEEPLIAGDVEGYARVRGAAAIRIAAGQSEFTALGCRELIATRSVSVIQPDCVRSGITESRHIASLAHAFQVAFAPHVGHGGAICAAANLHLSAAVPNFLAFECMFERNPLREKLGGVAIGEVEADGMVAVPQGPGLGVEIDMDVVETYRVQ
jgi:L-alanine-DL-glutamate epimerase-like enolase superfamily enzyme